MTAKVHEPRGFGKGIDKHRLVMYIQPMNATEQIATDTCEFCGQPGRLIPHWNAATCDEGFQGEPGWKRAKRMEKEKNHDNVQNVSRRNKNGAPGLI